jgi:ubiquinone/menaquinone biosynthesis C-methylase UbiE/uncharacterized protein YbaR (Trm112 family)
MRHDLTALLVCPICDAADLRCLTFEERTGDIDEGVLWCSSCSNWFPIQDGVLDLLTGPLNYADDRQQFWETHSDRLGTLGLSRNPPRDEANKDLQLIQQKHFDWYAGNEQQTYREYEKQPFWVAADKLAFQPWRQEIAPGSWLLDVGCAQGRSTFKLMDLPINVVGFDVSKALVRQAMRRYQAGSFQAQASFCVADASRFPFKKASFNYVLVYGVLHHLPDPAAACKEIARVLSAPGRYLGSENNRSAFRRMFDILQRLKPLWHEEAGPEALVSHQLISEAFRGTDLEIETHTSVYLPPHLVNLLSEKTAYRVLAATDKVAGAIPFVRENGGLIIINGNKPGRA